MPTIDRRQFLVVGSLAALGIGLTACTTDGDWVAIEASALDDLRKRLHGTVLIPGDDGFTNAWMPTNGRYRDTVPMVVARVADETDVVACVNWAREHNIQPVPRGGGHNYAGLSTTTGLIIDLSKLNAVTIDTDAATMVTGGAASNGDIFGASTGGGLILPGGTCLSVGIGGLALGGGIGYHTRWAGLTADLLTGTRMVTASGDIALASASKNPDLFWASRGGAGGNFGINTEFTFDLVPVPTGDIVYYRFDWRGADAALAMFSAVDALEQTAPPEFVASGMAQATPVGADGPREAIDVMLRGQFLGSIDDFMSLIAPLLAAAPPAKQQIVAQPFWETAKIFTSAEATNHSWGDISRYTDAALPASALQKMVDLVVDTPSRTETDNAAMFMLGWVGGDVVDRFDRTETAYVHRGMKNMVRPSPVWSNTADAGVADDLMDWTDDVISVFDPHTPRESYQNFPNRRIDDWAQQYYAENLDRLIDVKAEWDPDNLFHSEQSIPTAAS
ncbi:FAD-binding oxidoreductase [Glaciibacter superstes]|uniref:FAD-binding oxidoreductase n=1 Tax=Glaciibacter superstes TaxID=501023 RepID=UPI0003B30EF5|nr:FAD-binding oxidoreductase [Glaciibacter superstes]